MACPQNVSGQCFSTGVLQNLRVPPNRIEKRELNDAATTRHIFWALSVSKMHLRLRFCPWELTALPQALQLPYLQEPLPCSRPLASNFSPSGITSTPKTNSWLCDRAAISKKVENTVSGTDKRLGMHWGSETVRFAGYTPTLGWVVVIMLSAKPNPAG